MVRNAIPGDVQRGSVLLVTPRVLLIALATAFCSDAFAQTNVELKAMLNDALKTVQDLQRRVDALEAQKNTAAPAAQGTALPVAVPPSPSSTTAASASNLAGAPVIAPSAVAQEGATKPGGARLEISGQVMLDAIYDFKRVDPSSNATLRPSKIPVHCPGDAGCGKDGESIFSIRQSKIAFKGFIPTSLGEVTTLFDMDLFASAGGNTQARVLDAWAELGSFGAGQYYSLFMDVDSFPNTIDYWGPSGMVFVRNPQLRYTPYNSGGVKLAFSLEAPGTALDTGKVSEIDPALAASVTSRTKFPDLVANLRYDGEWGHWQAAGIVRQLGFDSPGNLDANPSGTESGYGINLSGAFNTVGKDRIVGAVAYGRGIASYMNDGGSDLAPNAAIRAEAVKSVGWFVYYDRYWSSNWSSSLGYSEHRQDNTDGQLANAFKVGRYASGNLLYYPVSNVTAGLEFLWGKLTTKDGMSQDDYRIQFSTKYGF